MQLVDAKNLLATLRGCAMANEYDADIRLAYIVKRIDEFSAADVGNYAAADDLKRQSDILGALMVAHHQAAQAQAQPVKQTAPIVLGGVGS